MLAQNIEQSHVTPVETTTHQLLVATKLRGSARFFGWRPRANVFRTRWIRCKTVCWAQSAQSALWKSRELEMM